MGINRQKLFKIITSLELFLIIKYRLSIPELAEFWFQNGSVGHFQKIAFANRFERKKVKYPLREAADERTDERTHDEHGKFEDLYTIGPTGNYYVIKILMILDLGK